MKKLTIIIWCILAAMKLSANEIQLCENGKTDYVIVFDQENAIASEREAVKELVFYLKKISGIDFQVSESSSGKKIVIGHNKDSDSFFGGKKLELLGDEEILLKTAKDGDIYLTGGRPRGTLYAVYYFLDNILGVHWYSPEFEYVPDKKIITLNSIDINERPAFDLRQNSSCFVIWNKSHGVVSPTWAARNRLNNNGSRLGGTYCKILDKYGNGEYFAPPSPCHSLFLLIPPSIYFEAHPEWWAFQNGKRQVYGASSGVNASYCLSNPELVQETAKRILFFLRQFPECKYINVSEGDGTLKMCECENCRKLLKEFGNKDSGLWINFVNQVADLVKKEFSNVKLFTFAYVDTAMPPENIKAHDNVAVQVCIWGKFRGLPYSDPGNRNGREFIETIFLPWTKICKNILIWDYIVTFNNFYQPQPDLLVNIDNVKFFKEHGVKVYYGQGTTWDYGGNGQPFKTWLLARCLWNPDNLDGEKLLEQFCNEYYGSEAGKYIYQYYTMLRDVNKKAGYYEINMAGWQGQAPHASLDVMSKANELFKKALIATHGNDVYTKHLRIAYASVLYMFINYYNEYKTEAEKRNFKIDDFSYFYDNLMKTASEFDLYANEHCDKLSSFVNKRKILGNIKLKATSSNSYGGTTPYYAFDKNIKTQISFGDYKGWLQVEFPQSEKINRISIIWPGNTSVLFEYKIEGSLDGIRYFDIVPQAIIQRKETDSDFSKKPMFSDHKLKESITVKFVRTSIIRGCSTGLQPSWTGISEEIFNASDSDLKKIFP